ncbi:aminotransferase [Pyronema domesticum]|uniref:Branched-chain-amino-acid aminotransferase n=1 Tax=Pyronema omphalodes (strain CBS 100304) TaxID=1076935 RepID=U4LV31_PYROM|nr:aminotransferase [Pyronema domesticum]CCX32171.1 Similar to Branched-chain-amino-acid aminotransferase, mitochondrial; acc. no. P38891 [Pyronema omphalodes CBS 100304]
MLRPSMLLRAARPVTRLASVRNYSSQAPALAGVDPSKMIIQRTQTPKELMKEEDLVFGRTFTDHMLSIEWVAGKGWSEPRITPYQNLSLDPATCVFHYGFSCFEGMKAYRTESGELRLFRPRKNMDRLSLSSARIALPSFDPDAMVECISKYVALEEKFVPKKRGYSLYLRPTMIGTQRTLGVGPPGSALFFVIASPVGPYYPSGFKAVSLEATSKFVRAWPGGTGDKKLGGNYAPCILPQQEAAKRGFHQNLWLFGEEGYVTEVGTMNLFTCWVNKEGVKEMVTAPLDGTILEGVTRDSILALAKEHLGKEGWKITERKYTIKEVADAADEGRLLEAFGAGTAAVVSPVRRIAWDGGANGVQRDINVPLPEGKEAGPIAERVWKWMEGIQYGDIKSDWSYPVKA